MTNREWILGLMKSDKTFLADMIMEYNPTCSDEYGWQDRWANPYQRRYEKVQGTWSLMTEREVFYDNSWDCEQAIIEWLDAEHKEEVEE